MKPSSVARLTIVVCLLAAAVETVLSCTSTARVSPSDAPIVLFIIGPYLLLAVFAWWQRAQPAASWALLTVGVALSVWGLYGYGEDSYRYHTEPEYRMVQRMAVFIVPVIQYVVVCVVGLGMLSRRLFSRRRQAANQAEPEAAADRPGE